MLQMHPTVFSTLLVLLVTVSRTIQTKGDLGQSELFLLGFSILAHVVKTVLFVVLLSSTVFVVSLHALLLNCFLFGHYEQRPLG